jgi:transposase
MTDRQIVDVDALKAASDEFTMMRRLAMRVRGVLRSGTAERLDIWLHDARNSGIYGLRRSARTLPHAIEAVCSAVLQPRSNGQTEGEINKLKALKRAMYGRAGIDLLGARMLPLDACTESELDPPKRQSDTVDQRLELARIDHRHLRVVRYQ